MTFNKWFPDAPVPAVRRTRAESRAWALRVAWYASTLMLVFGYVLLFVLWNA